MEIINNLLNEHINLKLFFGIYEFHAAETNAVSRCFCVCTNTVSTPGSILLERIIISENYVFKN